MDLPDTPSILTFPILPIDELIYPFLTKRFLVSINPIKSFREFFDVFPMVGIAEKAVIDNIRGDKIKITYGKIKSCQESHSHKDPLYELDIEGMGVGLVTGIVRERPLLVVQVEKLPYQEKIWEENSFKTFRLKKYCEHFLTHNIPFEEDQLFWREELKSAREIISFLAMVFLNHEEKWKFLEITDINVQMDFLLNVLPAQNASKPSIILPFPQSGHLPPPLPLH